MRPRPRSLSRALAPASLALLPACGVGFVHGSLEVFDGGTPTYYETEPNDSAFGPDYLTTMAPGDALEVCGSVDDGCCDPYDGFAIDTTDAVELHVELTALDGWSDLDVCVYDPWSDVFLACFESSGSYESGTVAIGAPAELHLVVRAWSGASDYVLRVEAYPLPGWYAASTAPADPSNGWEGYRAEDEGSPLVVVDARALGDGEDAPVIVRVAPAPAPRRADAPRRRAPEDASGSERSDRQPVEGR